MKKTITTIILIIAGLQLNDRLEILLSQKSNPNPEPQETVYEVVATMYNAVAGQCDSDPFVTAGMYKINPNKASEHKWIAMSRDMIARWGGDFHYGDLVKIEGAGHKDGVYRVVDTMNKRFKKRIDFLETAGTKHYKFNKVKIAKWKEQEQEQQNLLASI
ncbi:MAG TPA: hypothetical protein VMX17_01010 [Candidatus Glassbacteria bacterium]|nr:hypothetical protein [Candidatus Glassbacteria bacterium]